MVSTDLNRELIESGAELVRKLDESGLKPNAVFWFYFNDISSWKLVVAETQPKNKGPKEFYRLIQKLLKRDSNTFSDIHLEDVVLARPDAPFVNLLKSVIRTGPGVSGIRFKDNVIRGTHIDDAYIYRLARSG